MYVEAEVSQCCLVCVRLQIRQIYERGIKLCHVRTELETLRLLMLNQQAQFHLSAATLCQQAVRQRFPTLILPNRS